MELIDIAVMFYVISSALLFYLDPLASPSTPWAPWPNPRPPVYALDHLAKPSTPWPRPRPPGHALDPRGPCPRPGPLSTLHPVYSNEEFTAVLPALYVPGASNKLVHDLCLDGLIKYAFFSS